MSHPILCLEIILRNRIILRNVTIVAICGSAMATVEPTTVMGDHNMAIYTGFRGIAQIRPCPADVKSV
jgi:hypothetical protein